jgi:hypothetical protein
VRDSQRPSADWRRDLPSAEELVARITSDREKILRYAWIPQVLGGLVFLVLGYYMGHAHFRLIREGVRTPGRIVSYKQEAFRRASGSSSTAYMPVVEFHISDRFVQFKDWLGSSVAGSINVSVIVLYDPANPAVAMIDRPLGNWLPWGPVFAVGVLLLLASVRSAFRSLG